MTDHMRDAAQSVGMRDEDAIIFWYRNYKGEEGYRRVIPISLRYGRTEWHPEDQWLLLGYDTEKKAEREFALADAKNTVGPTKTAFAAAQPPAAPVETATKSAPGDLAPHNSGERLPSSDAAVTGADTQCSADAAAPVEPELRALSLAAQRLDHQRSSADTVELFLMIDERLADLREANETYRKSSWDRSGDIQRNDREILWLRDFRALVPTEPQGARTPAFDAMIANLVELDKQRTPGPWRKSHEAIGAPGCVNDNPHHLPLVAECDTDFGMYKTLGPLQAGKNARFIVALENAWPKILAALSLSRPLSNCDGGGK